MNLNQSPITPAEPLNPSQAGGAFHAHLSRQGNILFAGQPDAGALRHAAAGGVTTLINLRTPPEITPDKLGFDEPALAKELGLRYVTIPFPGGELAPAHADALAAALAETPADQSALIHCGSSERVGALWALYLNRKRDVPVNEAIAHGKAAGMRSPILAHHVRTLAAG